ncbi:MAG: DNA repair protein RecO [candidate division WOR-3 bacterium]
MIKTSYIETEGIVFKKNKYLESSGLIEVFTPMFGCKNFLVKGLYRKNRRFQSPLEQLSVNFLEIFYKENRELNIVTKAHILFYPEGIVKDLEKFNLMIGMIKILRKQKYPTESVGKLYELLKNSIFKLNSSRENEKIYFDFLENYLDIEGFMNDKIRNENLKKLVLKERIKHYETLIGKLNL